MIKLAPSVLSADFGCLAAQLQVVEKAGAHLIHIDIMDGCFVPNITIGPMVVSAIAKHTSLLLDVHLMINSAENFIDEFIAAGAAYLSFHLESSAHAHRLVQRIKSANVKAGVAINPATPVSALENIIDDVDLVTIMSVNPGFGGQAFIPGSIEKVAAVKRMIDEKRLGVEIEVDGGIDTSNALSVIRAGADILVAGSAVYGAPDVQVAVKQFLSVLTSA